MEQGCSQRRVRLALGEHLGKVLQASGPAAGDDRHRDCLGDSAGQRHVVPVQRAVSVHAGQQYLPGTQFDRARRPFDRVQPGRRAPAVDVDLPATGIGRDPFGIDGGDDALAAETFRAGSEKLRVVDGGCVDAHLVSAGLQQAVRVLDGSHTAADGERDKDLDGHPPYHLYRRGPALGCGRDVEKHQFVSTLGVVQAGVVHRVTGVAQVDKMDTFHDPPVLYVEAGDDSFGQHVLAGSL